MKHHRLRKPERDARWNWFLAVLVALLVLAFKAHA